MELEDFSGIPRPAERLAISGRHWCLTPEAEAEGGVQLAAENPKDHCRPPQAEKSNLSGQAWQWH
jgi:hypothetical protein